MLVRRLGCLGRRVGQTQVELVAVVFPAPRRRQIPPGNEGGHEDAERETQETGREALGEAVQEKQHADRHLNGADGTQQLIEVLPLQSPAPDDGCPEADEAQNQDALPHENPEPAASDHASLGNR